MEIDVGGFDTRYERMKVLLRMEVAEPLVIVIRRAEVTLRTFWTRSSPVTCIKIEEQTPFLQVSEGS